MKYPFFKESSYTFFNRDVIIDGGMDYPKMLNIEPTNECNYYCVMCSRQFLQRPIGMMSFDLYCSIIDDVVKNNKTIKWLTLHNDGEPLLLPDIAKMVQYARNSGAVEYVHFNTNGHLLDGNMAVALIEAGLDDLTVSIDAQTQETFASVKRAGSLDTVTGNVIQLLEIRNKLSKKNPWVRAKIIDMPITHKEINAFKEFWTPLVDEVQIQTIHNAAGALSAEKNQSHSDRYPCSLLWYAMAINWDGTVSPCCVDLSGKNIIGDLKNENMRQIFVHGKIKTYREKMLQGLEEELSPCNNCDVWRNGVNLFESNLLKKTVNESKQKQFT